MKIEMDDNTSIVLVVFLIVLGIVCYELVKRLF